jgi:hypothetical protein
VGLYVPLLEFNPYRNIAKAVVGRFSNGDPVTYMLSFAPVQDARTYFNYHHTAADTFDNVVPRELNENAAVLAHALADSKEAVVR